MIPQSIPGYLGNTPYRCVPNALPIERNIVAVKMNNASTVITDRLWYKLPISATCRGVAHLLFRTSRQQRF